MQTKNFLTTKQVAQALGVSDASLKRWCDKGLIKTMRTGGGHRRLPVGSVLQFLRDNGYPVLRPEILGLPAETGQGQFSAEQAKIELYTALAAGNETQARQAGFNLYLAGNKLPDIFDGVVAPVLRQLGEKWYTGELQIYQEHRAVEIMLRWLHELRLMLPSPAPEAPLAIGATLTKDPYQIPVMMAELALAEAGYRAEGLGCNLPGRTLAHAIRDKAPKVVWVSTSYIEYEPSYIDDFNEMAEAADQQGSTLVCGGRALVPELRAKLKPAVYCATMTDLARGMRATRGGDGDGAQRE